MKSAGTTVRTLLGVLGHLAAGCGAPPEPTGPVVADVEPSQASTLEPAAGEGEGPAPAEPPRCPIVPLQLVVMVGGQPRPFMSLDKQGALRTVLAEGLSPDSRAVARLDARGCLAGGGEVWVELTPEGNLWTIRQQVEVQGSRLLLPRPLEILSDGKVRFVEPSSDADSPPFHFEGYRAQAQCAAMLMLQAWLSMMPSMAVVDGNPIELSPPDPSTCPDLHAKQAP